MANPLGSSTRNVTVNITLAELRILRRLAGKSVGPFMREQYLIGLVQSHPDEAAQINEIREARAIYTRGQRTRNLSTARAARVRQNRR